MSKLPGHLWENRRKPAPLGREPTFPKKLKRDIGPGTAPTLWSHYRVGWGTGGVADTKGKGRVSREWDQRRVEGAESWMGRGSSFLSPLVPGPGRNSPLICQKLWCFYTSLRRQSLVS